MFSKEELISYVDESKTVWEIMEIKNCSKNTVKNHLKKHNIKTPKGFYSRGLKLGRPIGTPCSQKQKDFLSKKFKGKGNPFFNRSHTAETKKKMSENHADFSGDKNPFKIAAEKNPELIESIRNQKIDYWSNLDKEQRYEVTKKTIVGDLSKGHWANIISNASARDIKIEIDHHDAWNLYLEQHGKCALTDLPINLRTCDEVTASLDRINSDLGYTKDNIQWVHKRINIMKNKFSNEDFIFFCQQVALKSVRL